jgi:hypothetical protein
MEQGSKRPVQNAIGAMAPAAIRAVLPKGLSRGPNRLKNSFIMINANKYYIFFLILKQ